MVEREKRLRTWGSWEVEGGDLPDMIARVSEMGSSIVELS
jgi:hypothetical protein